MSTIRLNRGSAWTALGLWLGLALETALAGFPIEVFYRLPTNTSNKVFRVSIGAAPASDPDWIVATVVAGAVRVVDNTNKGFFSELWQGTNEDNVLLPFTNYVFKGIQMPAYTWSMDNLPHSMNLKYVMTPGDSLAPRKGVTYQRRVMVTDGATVATDYDKVLPWIWGWTPYYPGDIDVGPNGIAGFGLEQNEAGWGYFLLDLKREVIDWQQCVGSGPYQFPYPSGFYQSGDSGSIKLSGAGALTCNGWYLWVSPEKDPSRIVRPDCRDYTNYGNTRPYWTWRPADYNSPVHLESWSSAPNGNSQAYVYYPQAATDKLLVLLGNTPGVYPTARQTGVQTQAVAILRPRVAVMEPSGAGTNLFVLHKATATGTVWNVSSYPVRGGLLTATNAQFLFQVPPAIADPYDMTVDRAGRFYFCDRTAQRVYQYLPTTDTLNPVGAGLPPVGGAYQRDRFFSPTHLNLWTDTNNVDRLLVVERGGPGRISEWRIANNKPAFQREWIFTTEGHFYGGYAADPLHPDDIYTVTPDNQLLRFVVNYATGAWTVDAVWPMPNKFGMFPRVLNHPNKDITYIASAGGTLGARCPTSQFQIYRIDPTNRYALLPSAGCLPDITGAWWHDANGNGTVDANEMTGANRGAFASVERWGDSILDDFTFVATYAPLDTSCRMAPTGFDAFDNPIYDGNWTALFQDEGTRRKSGGTASALYCSSEESCRGFGHWISIDGDTNNGLYACHDFGSGVGSTKPWQAHKQYKLTRYVPDGQGGWKARFRVGQKITTHDYGHPLPNGSKVSCSSRMIPPIDGIVGVVDHSGVIHTYTSDGLYVDMLGIDRWRFSPDDPNVLWRRQSGLGMYLTGDDVWFANLWKDRRNGKVYAFLNRGSMNVYEVENWPATTLAPLRMGWKPDVGFSAATATTVEANTNLSLRVTLSFAAVSTVTVSYAVSPGTASARSDFTLAPGVLTFPPGVTNADIVVRILDDALEEGDEDFTVVLTNAVNGQLGPLATHRHTIADFEDTDRDGMPDSWEQRHGLNRNVNDSAGDPDTDGMSNLQEYKAGTTPTNRQSVLAIRDIRNTGDGRDLVLQWRSVSNRFYAVARATNLPGAVWLALGSNLPANPPLNLYTDQPPGAGRSFYRILLDE